MRRFFRILRAIFAGVSLLLCVAAAGVWVRSNLAWEQAYGGGEGRRWLLVASSGELEVVGGPGFVHHGQNMDGNWRRESGPRWTGSLVPGYVGVPWWNWELPGLRYASPAEPDDLAQFAILIHLAYPTALFSIVPLAWLIGHRTRRRRAARARGGLCATCGYDLRASPRGGRCPECGAVPAAEAAASAATAAGRGGS